MYIIIYRKRQVLGTKLGQDDISHRVRSTWYVYNTVSWVFREC